MTAERRDISESAAAILRRTSVFHDIDEGVLKNAAANVRRQSFSKDQLVFQIGDESDGLYVIVSGRVGITNIFFDGKEMILNILEENDIFGEVGAIDGLPRTAGAIAMEDSVLLHLDGPALRQLIRDEPTLCHGLTSVLCSRIRWTSAFIEDRVFRDTRTRLAKRLLMLADLYGDQTDEGIRINIRLSQDHLGRMLGVSRESISKEGAHLKDHHAVSFRHGVITIHDRAYLESLAALS